MISPHGGKLVEGFLRGMPETPGRGPASQADNQRRVGFRRRKCRHCVFSPWRGSWEGRLPERSQRDAAPDGLPWTIPIVLDASHRGGRRLKEGKESFSKRETAGRWPFSTSRRNSNTAKTAGRRSFLTMDKGPSRVPKSPEKKISWRVRSNLLEVSPTPSTATQLKPQETRILFRKWLENDCRLPDPNTPIWSRVRAEGA